MRAFWNEEYKEKGWITVPTILLDIEGMKAHHQILMGNLLAQIDLAIERNQFDTRGVPYTTMVSDRIKKRTGFTSKDKIKGIKNELIQMGLVEIYKQKDLLEHKVITKLTPCSNPAFPPDIWYINPDIIEIYDTHIDSDTGVPAEEIYSDLGELFPQIGEPTDEIFSDIDEIFTLTDETTDELFAQ